MLAPARPARDRLPGRWLLLVVVTGYAVASVGLVLTISTPTSYPAVSTAAAGVALVAGLGLIAVGMVGVWDRASLAVGPVTTGLGVVWLAPVWVGWDGGVSAARSVAMLVVPFSPALLVHLAAVPDRAPARGRRPEGVSVAVVYLVTAGYTLTRALVRDPFRDLYCWSNCRDNVFLLAANAGLARALDSWWGPWSRGAGPGAAGTALGRLGVATRVGRGCSGRCWFPWRWPGLGRPSTPGCSWPTPPRPRLTRGSCGVPAAGGVPGAVVGGWGGVGSRRGARRAVVRLSADLVGAAWPRILAAPWLTPSVTPARVAYWLPESARHVDSEGRTTPAHAPGARFDADRPRWTPGRDRRARPRPGASDLGNESGRLPD